MTNLEGAKYIYEFAKKTNFDYEEERLFRLKYRLTKEVYNKYLNLYLLNVLHVSEEEYQKITAIREFSKEVYDVKTNKVNPVLKKLGLEKYYLYTNIEEKIMVGEYIYNYIDTNVNHGCEELKEYFGISTTKIKELYFYYDLYLARINPKLYRQKESEKELRISNKNQKEAFRFTEDFEGVKTVIKVYHADTFEEVIDIIEKSHCNLRQLKDVTMNINKRLKDDTADLIISEKLDAYQIYHNEQLAIMRENEKLARRKHKCEEIKPIIMDYLDSHLTVKEYINNHEEITKDIFKTYIKLLEEFDHDLYQLFMVESKERDNEYKNRAIEQIDEIIYLINNGINIDGYIRKFDLIDFLVNCKLSIFEFEYIARDYLSDQDYRPFKTLFNDSYRWLDHDLSYEKIILETEVRMHVLFDEYNNCIPNSGIILSDEIKIAIFDYLKKNNIPINEKTYNILYKRYLKDEESFCKEIMCDAKLVR